MALFHSFIYSKGYDDALNFDLENFSHVQIDDVPFFSSWTMSATKPILAIETRMCRKDFQGINKLKSIEGFIREKDHAIDKRYMLFYYRLHTNEWEKFIRKHKNEVEEISHENELCDCLDINS